MLSIILIILFCPFLLHHLLLVLLLLLLPLPLSLYLIFPLLLLLLLLLLRLLLLPPLLLRCVCSCYCIQRFASSSFFTSCLSPEDLAGWQNVAVHILSSSCLISVLLACLELGSKTCGSKEIRGFLRIKAFPCVLCCSGPHRRAAKGRTWVKHATDSCNPDTGAPYQEVSEYGFVYGSKL